MPQQATEMREVIDAARLQELQEAFTEAFDIPTMIVDADGFPVTVPSHWEKIIEKLEVGDLGESCRWRLSGLLDVCRRSGKPATSHTLYSGFATTVVPIASGEDLFGAWVLTYEGERRKSPRPAKSGGNVRDGDSLPAAVRSFLHGVNPLLVRLLESDRDPAAGAGQPGNQDQLEAANAMVRKFVDASHVAMYICDYYTGELLLTNRAFARLVKTPGEELLGRRCYGVMGTGEETFCAFCPRRRLLDENNQPTEPQSWVYFNTRFNKWFRCTNQAVVWSRGRMAQMVTILDVTQEHRMQEELQELAFKDHQTGLPNGQKMMSDIRHFVASRRVTTTVLREKGDASVVAETLAGESLDLICFDLSSLRLVRDAFGRETADKLRSTVLEWMGKEDFGTSTLYRLDGEEYCILVTGAVPEAVAMIANRLAARFTDPWLIGMNDRNTPLFCAVHVSIIFAARDRVMGRDLLALSSRTLEAARKGRQIVTYDPGFDDRLQERLRLDTSLIAAVNNGMAGFAVNFQPIVHLKTGTWKGLEVLCRWSTPEFGTVSPGVFIPAAEGLGLIGAIGDWVLEEGIKNAKERELDRHPGFFLSVNVSPMQMMDRNFPRTVADILHRHEYPGAKLSLEVTESTEFTFTGHTMETIDSLLRLGVRLALDDFGTGYSSFNNLKNLPVSLLKTEAAFVNGIENDNYMQYFFYIMSEIAHANEMQLIAEGVETYEQMRVVQKNGADFIQGFYFGKPLPAEALDGMLHRFEIRDEAFVRAELETVDIAQWLDGKNAYTLTPAILKLLNQCLQILMADRPVDESFAGALSLAGEFFDLGRAFAYVKVEGDFSASHEWCGPGSPPQKARLETLRTLGMSEALQQSFRRDGLVMTADFDTLPEGMFKVLNPEENRALALMPMWDDDELLGFIGFDHPRQKSWTPDTILVLRNLALIMAGCIKREILKTRAVDRRQVMKDMLDRSEMNIIVVDANTFEILWLNRAIREHFNLGDEAIGKKCYERLHFRDTRCPGCGVAEVLDDPDAPDGEREAPGKRVVTTFDHVTEWEPGRAARIEYLIDLPRCGNAAGKTEILERILGMASRERLLLETEVLSRECAEGRDMLSLAYVRADDLRNVNTNHGYEAGQKYLAQIQHCIMSVTRAGDHVGRIAFNTFLVAYPNCSKDLAKARLLQARDAMARQPALFDDGNPDFSFAVFDLGDLDGRFSVERLTVLAERELDSRPAAAVPAESTA